MNVTKCSIRKLVGGAYFSKEVNAVDGNILYMAGMDGWGEGVREIPGCPEFKPILRIVSVEYLGLPDLEFVALVTDGHDHMHMLPCKQEPVSASRWANQKKERFLRYCDFDVFGKSQVLKRGRRFRLVDYRTEIASIPSKTGIATVHPVIRAEKIRMVPVCRNGDRKEQKRQWEMLEWNEWCDFGRI